MIRKEYSDMLVRQVSKSRYERRICLTYTIEADTIKQARSRLSQIEGDVINRFRALSVETKPMDGYERLAVFHKCLHLEEPRKFRFNWDSLNQTGLSSKDYIAPSSFFFKDGRYFRTGATFGAVSFLQIRATKIYDTLLDDLLNLEGSQIVSIHAKALDQNLPELMAMWKESADIQTAEMLKLPVPEAENITVVTKPSEFQKELVAELGERAEDVRNRLVEPKEDNMLKITSDGRKLALDQRLAFAELPDDPDSKINACIKNVLQLSLIHI